MYLFINQIFYDIFIPKYIVVSESGGYEDIFSTFLAKFQSYLSGQDTAPLKYAYYPSHGIYDIGRLLLNLLLVIPIVLSLPSFLRRLSKGFHNRNRAAPELYLNSNIYAALIGVIFMQAFAYGTITGISTQVLLFIGPVIAIIGLNMMNRKKIRILFITAIVLLSIILTSLYIPNENANLHYSEAEPSAQWFFNSISNQEPSALSSQPWV
jgi:hypothetical protein